MTRKRFIKLVMGAGFDRNEANILADARPGGMTYDEWNEHYYVHAFWDKVEVRDRLFARRAARRLRNLSGTVAKTSTSLAGYAKAVQDAMQNIMGVESPSQRWTRRQQT